jgi:outer membrane protein assembly factor BamD (BamD/ComL family)
MRVRSVGMVWLLGAALLLSACNGGGSDVPRFLRSDPGSAPDVPIPGQYTAGGVAPGSAAQDEERRASEAELRAEFAQRAAEAQALWNEASRTQDPADAADLYGDIADDYPEYPNAAEARYREGLGHYRAGDWSDAIRVLRDYMVIAPVNPHLGEVEEMVYRSSLAIIEEDSGFLEIFKSADDGLNGLRWVALYFPAGSYPDDALLRLAQYYRDDDELETAMLFYKELLLRYPDSEWSFRARLGLAETYVARDQGDPYHAGFVDRDPREPVPDDERAQAHAGPVKSALELALEQYDIFLERIALDPGRRAEYAPQVAQAQAARRSIIAKLAAKYDRIAAWYADQGDAQAAQVYRRAAAQRRGEVTGPPVPFVASPTPAPARPVSPPAPTPAPRPRQPVQPATPGVPPPPPPPSLPTMPAPSPRPTPTVPVSPAPGARLPVPPPPPPPAWPPGR